MLRSTGIAIGLLGLLGALGRADELPRAKSDAAAELRALTARVSDPKSDKNELWDDLIAFRRVHYGAPEALQAAELLTKIPSPLDALDPKRIPASERHAWLPEDVVAVLGESRGRQWDGVRDLAVSPDEKRIASCDRNTLYLWDADTLQEITRVSSKDALVQVAFLPDSRSVITCGTTIRIWDVSRSPPVERWAITPPPTNQATTVLRTPAHMALAPDGQHLVVSSETTRAIYDLRGPKPKPVSWEWERGKHPRTMRIDSAGRWLAEESGSDDNPKKRQPTMLRLSRWQPDKPALVSSFITAPDGWVLSRDGNWLAARVRAAEYQLDVFDLSTGVPIRRKSMPYTAELVAEQIDVPISLAISPNGQLLVTADRHGELAFIPLTPEARTRLGVPAGRSHINLQVGSAVVRMEFARNGQTLLIADKVDSIRALDFDGGRWGFRHPLHGHRGGCWYVQSPDGRTIVSAGYDALIHWRLTPDGFRETRLAAFHGPSAHLAFAPDGQSFALANRRYPIDKTSRIEIWRNGDVPQRTGTIDLQTVPPASLAFTPDGKRLFAIVEKMPVRDPQYPMARAKFAAGTSLGPCPRLCPPSPTATRKAQRRPNDGDANT